MQFKLITSITLILTVISLAHSLDSAHEVDLEERDTSDEGWIDLTVGLLRKREDEPQDASSSLLQRRTSSPPISTPVYIKRDPDSGSWIWPNSFSEAKQMMASKRDWLPQFINDSIERRSQQMKRAMRVIITWYTGHDLLNPACFSDSANWAPTDQSMAAAVTIEWPGKPKCGAFVKIQHANNPKKKIIVRIVDSCGGCAPGSPHIDLTIGAFKKLYDLDVGIVDNLKAKIVKTPFPEDQWPDFLNRYGPQETIQVDS